MNEHLSIKIGKEYIVLSEDYNFDIELVNPYFNDAESFTYPIEAPIENNRHLLKNVDDIRSDIRLVDFANERVTIFVEGLPLFNGKVRVEDEQEIDEIVSFSCVSTVRGLADLIGNLNCQDIPIKDKIQIGEMIGDVYAWFGYNFRLEVKHSGKTGFLSWKSRRQYSKNISEEVFNKFQLQALGFSYPAVCREKDSITHEAMIYDEKPVEETSFINVSESYPHKKYCNARVCYTHYKMDLDGKSSKSVSTADTYDPYYVLEANRAQSGVCFYVMYFLDCLFHSLSLSFDQKDLMTVGDLMRLAFFTTHCKFDLERKYSFKGDDEYDFNNIDAINRWLSSRNTKGKLEWGYKDVKEISSAILEFDGIERRYSVGETLPDGTTLKYSHFKIEEPDVDIRANIMNMYANSKNFPNTGVNSIIDSLWASFGIRFLMDYEKKSVSAVLIRNLFRDNSSIENLSCELISSNKVNENITGVRMKYSAESDRKEKHKILSSGKKDFNTSYDYSDYSNVDSSKSYLDIVKKQSNSDTTCYIDVNTGNAYRLKVNADAKDVSELKPALFEVGGYSGVEIGDCSEENSDYVIELVSDFEPMMFNDVNGKNEKKVGTDKKTVIDSDQQGGGSGTVGGVNADDAKPILAAFVDEDMNHENIQFQIDNVIGSDHADFTVSEVLTTDESYDPSNTEDGNSPLQHYDWGLAVAIMRGGGTDSRLEPYDYNYDDQGNSKWRIASGEYAMSSDSIDNWGNDYDYNGVQPGIGDDERFSLKVRAFKEVNGEILCADDERDKNGNIVRKIRSRGLFDTFMSEYSYFLLNRKLVVLRFRCEVSELTNIQWEKRYNIKGYVGWINKLKCNVSVKEGLGIVEAEMYIL